MPVMFGLRDRMTGNCHTKRSMSANRHRFLATWRILGFCLSNTVNLISLLLLSLELAGVT
uniref:Uncharacterized protein n=1 Tax=Chenopodium quinoa TaxID=63459 RepID=A0A803MVR5_CHEQI